MIDSSERNGLPATDRGESQSLRQRSERLAKFLETQSADIPHCSQGLKNAPAETDWTSRTSSA
jgi:hypothetical protein